MTIVSHNNGHASNGKVHKSPRPEPRNLRADSALRSGSARGPCSTDVGLAAHLRSLRSADNVSIGSQNYEASDIHVTGSWADVQKIVAGIRWLKRGYLPYGMLVGLIGEPKGGKSALALGGVVGPIITGRNWFNSLESAEVGYVVWCDTERRAAINLDRSVKWGLPLDRIKTPYQNDPLKVIDLNSTEDIDRLYNVVCRYKAKLVVVDSFRGSHKGDENNSQIAESLQNLGRVAEQTQTAILILHHTRKLFVDEEVSANAGRGSNAFLAMVACQWAVDLPDPGSEWRRLQVLGENLGVAPQPIGFRVSDAGVEFGSAPVRPRKETQKGDAGTWLRNRMKPGKVYQADELELEAEQAGHATRTLRRAAEELKIVKKQKREKGKIVGWEWRLP